MRRRLSSSSGEAAISADFHPTITLHPFKPLIPAITAAHSRRRRKPATAALKLPPPALQFSKKPPRLRPSAAAALLRAKQRLKPATLGAVEGLIMPVSEESERRELGPADIVRPIKHRGGGRRFRKSVAAVHARRKLQGFRGFGPGGAGAGAGLPGLLLPFEWD